MNHRNIAALYALEEVDGRHFLVLELVPGDTLAERIAHNEGGYSLEMAIPFKSLRFKATRDQIWGINFRRSVRWKNETSYLAPIPAAYG